MTFPLFNVKLTEFINNIYVTYLFIYQSKFNILIEQHPQSKNHFVIIVFNRVR